MITYNGIIEYFSYVAKKHLQINSFSYGDIDEADLDKITEYPLLHVNLNNVSVEERTLNYDIGIMLVDLVSDSDRQENIKNATSNTLQILQDLQTEWLKGKKIVAENTKLTGSSLTCTPIEGLNNRLVGFSTSINIEGINESTADNIPYHLTEDWEGVKPTPPVPILDTNGFTWYSATVLQQGNLDYAGNNYITTWTPIVGSYGNLTGQISGSDDSLVFDFPSNAIHIKSGSDPTNFNTQKSIQINDTYFVTLKNITGGANEIATFATTTGNKKAIILITNGLLSIKNAAGQVTGLIKIHDLQTNNPKLTQSDAVIRKLPLTLAIRFPDTKGVEVYYGGTERITNTVDVTGTSDIAFGAIDVTGGVVITDIMIQEIIHTRGAMSEAELNDVIEWLNNR